MKNKTKRLYLRFTEDEIEMIRKKSEKYQTMSGYLREALKEFSDSNAKQRLEIRKNLADKYSDFDEKLAHLGGNLNQTMRRINEVARADGPVVFLLKNDMLPLVKNAYSLLNEFRIELRKITKYALK